MDTNVLKFGLFIIVCTCAVRVGAQGTTTEYKDECIVDKAKKPTEDGNYKDCTGEDHVADGSTDCCNVDGVVDCCDKNASWWNLIWICIGIGTTTIVLALLCFWIYWCDEQTFPWIGPYKRKWDERTGKCKSKVCCCCVDDDEDDYKTSASPLPKKTGLPDREIRPESSISQRSSYYDDEKVVGSRNVESDVVEVQPGPEPTEMPPEYQAQVKDDFLNF